MELALEGKFGTLAVMKDGKLDSVSLEDVVGNNTKIGAVSGNTEESNIRKVTMDDDLVKTARDIGINLGGLKNITIILNFYILDCIKIII